MPRLLVASAAAIALTLAPVAAVAATPTPTPTVEPSIPSFTVTPVGAGLVADGESLSLSLRVDNAGSTTLLATDAVVELGTSPLTSSAAIDSWLDEGSGVEDPEVVDRPAFAVIDPDTVAGSTTTVSADDLDSRAPGVYALAATYGGLSDRAVVTLLPGGDADTVEAAVVVAVTAGPRSDGLIPATELAAATAPDGRLARILDAVEGTPAVLAVDPAVLASIRVLGTSAPVSALAWLTRLDRLPNDRFALQFGDADVSAQVDAGRQGLLVPSTLDYAMSADQQAAPTPTPDPAGTPDPNPSPSAVLPTVDELLAVEDARPSVYWPADGAASATVAETLTAWSEPDSDPVTLVSSASVGGPTTRAPSLSGDSRALVYDDRAAQALRDAAAADDFDRGSPLAELTARVWLAASTATGPLLLTSDRLHDVDAFGLTAALDAVWEVPGLRATPFDDIAGGEASAIALTSTADAERVEAATALEAGAARLADLATILDEPWQITAREEASTLQLLGAGWSGDAGWGAAIAQHHAQTAETLASVSIVPFSPLQLAGYDTPMRVYIDNKLPWAANLTLEAQPDDLRLDVQRTTPVVAAAGVNTPVTVPVRARVGSGEVSIEFRLYSPTRVLVGPVRTADVTVRADWETYGLAAIIVLVGGLIVVGVVRTVLRRRRARRAPDGAPADEVPPTDAADG